MTHILFVCIQNAGRSQMAQALFTRAAGARHAARSAGSRPAGHVHPEVVAVMREIEIELSGAEPHKLDGDDLEWADVVVTMGCGDECPFVPGLSRDDWPLKDPKGLPTTEVRRIRDEIRDRVAALVDSHGWRRSAASS